MASHIDHIAYINADLPNLKGGIGGYIWGAATSAATARQQAIANLNALEPGLADKHEIQLVACTGSLYETARFDGNVAWLVSDNGKACLEGSVPRAPKGNLRKAVKKKMSMKKLSPNSKILKQIKKDPGRLRVKHFICYEKESNLIWGLGFSEDQAANEAWGYVAEYDQNLVNNLPLVTLACTKALYDAIEAYSGEEVMWKVNAGGFADFSGLIVDVVSTGVVPLQA